jgi:hypothetical protein
MPEDSEDSSWRAASLAERKENSAVSCRQPLERGRGDGDLEGGVVVFDLEGLPDLGGTL